MPVLPSRIAMAAGDYFMYGQDRRMRRAGLPGNTCHALLHLGPEFALPLLRQRIARSPIVDWLARVETQRTLPALFPMRWRQGKTAVPVLYEHPAPPELGRLPWFLPEIVRQRSRDGNRPPGIVLDVFPHADGTHHLFISWNHTHMDARGLDLLLGHLNTDDAAAIEAATAQFIHPRQIDARIGQWWSSIGRARGSVKWLNESGAEPLFSLVSAPPPRGKPCQNHYRVLYFTEAETAAMDRRCEMFNCTFRRSQFYLAASLRALHQLASRRGNQDGAYLVPVPHDTRKRGSKGPIFSNHLSILFYRIAPAQANSISAVLAELSRQMADQIRDRFPEACMAALDMFRPLPVGFYLKHLGKPTRGKFAAFSFSDSGDTCAHLPDFCGGKILQVTHLVPAWRPPGLMTVFLRFRNRLAAQLSWVDDCVSTPELEDFAQDLRRALLEEAAG